MDSSFGREFNSPRLHPRGQTQNERVCPLFISPETRVNTEHQPNYFVDSGSSTLSPCEFYLFREKNT
jgi:hypothetical protein